MRKVFLGSLALLVMWTGAAWAGAIDEIHEREGKMCLVYAIDKLPRRAEVVGSSVDFLADEKLVGQIDKRDRQRRYGGKIGVEMAGQKIGYIFGCSVMGMAGRNGEVVSRIMDWLFVMKIAQ